MKRKHTKPASAKASANCGKFPECISPPAPCARMMPTVPRLTSGPVTAQDSVLPFSKGICKSASMCYTDQGPLAELPSTAGVCTHSQHSCRFHQYLCNLWTAKALLEGQTEGIWIAGCTSFDKIPGKGASEIVEPVETIYAHFRFSGPARAAVVVEGAASRARRAVVGM